MPPVENENVEEIQREEGQQQDNQQQQQQEDVGQASTGNEAWDKIIDGVAGIGDNNAQKPAGGKAADGSQQDPNSRQPAGAKGARQPQQTDNNQQQQRQGDGTDQGVQPARTPARKFGTLFQSDNKGDIYDANGALIARQGAQRMIFHRLWPTIEAKDRELAGYRSRLENYENANQLAKKEGLSLDEQGAALQMFVQWKRDPVKMMNTLLTLAEQSGRDISSIRQGTGPGVADIRAAVQEIVQDAIKPFTFLTEQQRAAEEDNALLESVQTEYHAFMEEFPDAKVHEGSIANVMRDKNLNHREAYFAVRAFAAERGLDWTKPLAPQLQQQQQRNPSGGGNNRRQLPPMNGRSRSEVTHVEEGAMDQANANDSWDAIARRAMKRHGIEV